MRVGRFALLLLALGCGLGCVPPPEPTTTATRMRIGERPAKGSVSEAAVGDVVYSKFNYAEVTGAKLLANFDSRYLLGRISVPAGTFLQMRGGADPQFCTQEMMFAQAGLSDVVCFKQAGANKFAKVRVPSLKFGNWTTIESGNLSYEDAVDLEHGKGFRQDLLYEGISGSVVTLGYREYADNFARPAYQQQVTYTLNTAGDTEVGFRGARIRILAATNSLLRYELLTGIP